MTTDPNFMSKARLPKPFRRRSKNLPLVIQSLPVVRLSRYRWTRRCKIYEEFYLIRNEGGFKLYAFEDGRAVEPDFVLCARENGANENTIYQVFIEPKGGHLIDKDQWKQDFLLAIEKHAKTAVSNIQGSQYFLLGMPFFNEEKTKFEFNKQFDEKLKLVA